MRMGMLAVVVGKWLRACLATKKVIDTNIGHFRMYFSELIDFFRTWPDHFSHTPSSQCHCLLSQSLFDVADIDVVYSHMLVRILVNLKGMYICH